MREENERGYYMVRRRYIYPTCANGRAECLSERTCEEVPLRVRASWQAACDAVLNNLRDSRRVHGDLRALEAFGVAGPQLLRVCVISDVTMIQGGRGGKAETNSRVVPDGEMLHAQRVRRPLIVVGVPRWVEDLDDSRNGRDRHHDKMLAHILSSAR